MKLYYYISPTGNFGDDINSWLWHEVLPDCWADDDTTFVPIGTILDNRIPNTKHKVIYGTGAGYVSPPDMKTLKEYDIKCVRGPLTAELLTIDSTKAVTDSAIIIGSLFNVVPPEKRHGIVFMPHLSAAINGSWEVVCRNCGIEYLDPREDAKKLIKKIASAELVLADAMHGAIIADTMRVPWIPLITSAEVHTMKWLDWTMSMEVNYKPIVLPQSCLFEWLLNFSTKANNRGDALFLDNLNSDNQIVLPTNATEIVIEHARTKFFNAKKTVSTPNKINFKKRVLKSAFKISKLLLGSAVGRFLSYPIDKFWHYKAETALKKAMRLEPNLSQNEVYKKKLNKMWELLNEVQEKYTSKNTTQ